MWALIQAQQIAAEQDSVMLLLRYLLRELRCLQPMPTRDAAWPFRLAARPTLTVPKTLLTLQPFRIQYTVLACGWLRHLSCMFRWLFMIRVGRVPPCALVPIRRARLQNMLK